MLRQGLLGLARSERARSAVEMSSLSRPLVERFVAGTDIDHALAASERLADDGRLVTLDYLGEDTLDRNRADAVAGLYVSLLRGLADLGLAQSTEVSIKLSALGQALSADGAAIALANAWRICESAADAGTTVTVDMENYTTTESTLSVVSRLRVDYPATAAVIQAYLHRSESDCRDLAKEGARVRLCKCAYREPASVAYQRRAEVRASYLRCADVLLTGKGYPMFATHDPDLINAVKPLADQRGRHVDAYELQMLFGVRPAEQLRLSRQGHRVRVYVPFGEDWYGYLMRRLAERPANLSLFLRALASSN
jgi:proline dehydrogenase